MNGLRKIVRQYLIEIKEIEMPDKELEKNLLDRCYGDELPIRKYHRGFELLQNLIAGKLPYKADTEITYWDE